MNASLPLARARREQRRRGREEALPRARSIDGHVSAGRARAGGRRHRRNRKEIPYRVTLRSSSRSSPRRCRGTCRPPAARESAHHAGDVIHGVASRRARACRTEQGDRSAASSDRLRHYLHRPRRLGVEGSAARREHSDHHQLAGETCKCRAGSARRPQGPAARRRAVTTRERGNVNMLSIPQRPQTHS
jgi:hypothetical protein